MLEWIKMYNTLTSYQGKKTEFQDICTAAFWRLCWCLALNRSHWDKDSWCGIHQDMDGRHPWNFSGCTEAGSGALWEQCTTSCFVPWAAVFPHFYISIVGRPKYPLRANDAEDCCRQTFAADFIDTLWSPPRLSQGKKEGSSMCNLWLTVFLLVTFFYNLLCTATQQHHIIVYKSEADHADLRRLAWTWLVILIWWCCIYEIICIRAFILQCENFRRSDILRNSGQRLNQTSIKKVRTENWFELL